MFTRQDTWASQAAPWVTYLSRSSYLLQQGHFVADILYYYGQDSNITALYGSHLPPCLKAMRLILPTRCIDDSVGRKRCVGDGQRHALSLFGPRSRARLMSLDVLKQIER